MKPSADDMQLINCYTRTPLSPDDVYVFKMKLCDNELDKEYEHFSSAALMDLARLFLGKTGITKGRVIARIFKTELLREETVTKLGDPYVALIGYAYIINNPFFQEAIQWIDGRDKLTVNIGCSVRRRICSICGKELSDCEHEVGKTYDGKLCVGELYSAIDVYDWSFERDPPPTPELLERVQRELDAAKNDIAALLWLNGDCEYCRFGQKDEYCGASRWTCKLGGAADCRPEWRGQEKTD